MTAAYDDQNIFAKIIRGEIPCDKVYEDEHVLILVDFVAGDLAKIIRDFSANASSEEIAAFMRAVGHIAGEKGLDGPGYRILANHGRDGRQEVPHFHMHIFGGTDLGIMIKTSMG
jgi:diadenosine tetraphosphate (Ap4A) HIT family hydrolase